MIKEYPLPEGMDTYILNGMKKGKRIKRMKTISKLTGLTAALLLVMFIGAIRVSPVFASYAVNIPGLEYIVELIQNDKGLQAAVENEYIQHVNKSDEADGIVFTVKDIIADSANIIVFYSIENKGGYKWPFVAQPKMLDENGNELRLSPWYGRSFEEDRVFEGKITYKIIDEQGAPPFHLPDTILISTTIGYYEDEESNQSVQYGTKDVLKTPENTYRELKHQYQVPVTIDKSKFVAEEKIYTLNQTVEVQGQKITFDTVRISPTRLEMDVSFDPANTMKIFSFEDLKVVDEQGREWGRFTNGVGASLINENQRKLYLQSNYFTSPKKLYITGSSIRALDKEKLKVMVDINNKKFLNVPDDKLKLTDIQMEGKKIAIFYTINTKDEHRGYSVFSSEATDANNNKLESITAGDLSGGPDGVQKSHNVYKGRTQVKGPVILTINDYPNWIQGSFRVDVIK